jgi:hypothetical protein
VIKLDIIGTWEYKQGDDIEYIVVEESGSGEYIKMSDGIMLYRNKIYSNALYIDVDKFQFEYNVVDGKLWISDKMYHKIDRIFQDFVEEKDEEDGIG